jgi:hypothetical protein
MVFPLQGQVEVPDFSLPEEEEALPEEPPITAKAETDSPFPTETGGYGLFDRADLFECTIKSDFVGFLADRGGKSKGKPAVISYRMPNGNPMDLPMEIEVRGHYRRDPLICNFPPVKLDFDKDMTLPAPFMGQNKIKLVTHCAEDQYIFREYYLYLVYQMLTARSFRVRLARVTYQDINDARPIETRYAFLIESEEEMSARLGGQPFDEDIPITAADVDQEQLAMVHLFNYMVANKDFNVQVRQNLKIVDPKRGTPWVIPYDFDWSGMVNAPYTKASTNGNPVYEDRQRFQPLCLSVEQYEALIARFQDIKKDVFDLYANSPYLTDEVIAESLGYYKQFYRNIKQGNIIDKVFREGCP